MELQTLGFHVLWISKFHMHQKLKETRFVAENWHCYSDRKAVREILGENHVSLLSVADGFQLPSLISLVFAPSILKALTYVLIRICWDSMENCDPAGAWAILILITTTAKSSSCLARALWILLQIAWLMDGCSLESWHQNPYIQEHLFIPSIMRLKRK